MSLRPQPVNFDVTWELIKDTASKVIRLEVVPKNEWNDRFHDVYKLCVAYPEPHSERLYNESKNFLDSHIKALYKVVSVSRPQEMLTVYYEKFITFQQGIHYLSTLYIYLNNQFILKHKCSNNEINYTDSSDCAQLMEIKELGAHLWKENMIVPLENQLVSLLLIAINEDRLGKPQNVAIIKGVIDSLVYVEEHSVKSRNKLYQMIFEKPFIAATRVYYSAKARALHETENCSSYMEKVLNLLDIERTRLNNFIPPSSHKKVIQECENCMVGEYLEFLQQACATMVENESGKDLHNMYLLLRPVESGLQLLIKQVEQHIKNKGLLKLKNFNPKDANYVSLFVEDVLCVYKHYVDLIKNVFNNDKSFLSALDMACTDIINHRSNPKMPCRSPEILARYFDGLLRKSNKSLTELEIDEKLTSAIDIFKYINDKDVFQKFYSKMLAKRLIYSLYVALDLEETIINKLKQACGYEFTSKLHRMFTDIKGLCFLLPETETNFNLVSDDLNKQFFNKLSIETANKMPFTFGVFILQACAWPMCQTVASPCNIPQSFELALKHFENFYNNRFNGRKLTWLHHMSNSEVRFSFTKKSYTVIMATFHTSIILLFENSDQLTYDHIQQNTNLNDDQLSKHLQSFVDSKILLLADSDKPLALPSTSDDASTSAAVAACPTPVVFSKQAKFILNTNFSNNRIKFKLIVVPAKEAPQVKERESEQTHASIEEDRKLFLQAAIVRIMKARKTMRHNQIIEEVINQSKHRFTPNVNMIKKAIESLIEKQYIERNPHNSPNDEYLYIA